MKIGNYKWLRCSVCGGKYIMTSNGKSDHKCTEIRTNNDPLLGAVIHKQINYEITIGRTIGVENIPIEKRDDFIEWIKLKSAELGIGSHYEYYYDHDESRKSVVEIEFFVKCI